MKLKFFTLNAFVLALASSAFADAPEQPFLIECEAAQDNKTINIKIETTDRPNRPGNKNKANYAINGVWNDQADVEAYVLESETYSPDLNMGVSRLTATLTVDSAPNALNLDIHFVKPNADDTEEWAGTLYSLADNVEMGATCDVKIKIIPQE